MSKRPERSEDTDSNDLQLKKARTKATITNNNHSPDCQDPDCEGCDVGEVEISFVQGDETVQPTANELLEMAKDEQGNTDMARRLFDMALESFETEEGGKTGLGYAQCLVELGRALAVDESIREGYQLFVAVKTPTVDSQLWHSRAALALARSIRQQKSRVFEELRMDLENTDGEIEDEVTWDELLVKDQVSKEEHKFYKEAIGLLDKVLANHATLDEKALVLARQAMYDMREYGELLEQPNHATHVKTLFDTLTRYIQLFNYDDDDTLLTLWGACLLHQQKFATGKDKEEMCIQAEKLIQQAKDVYFAKYKKENASAWELYAMLKMSQSDMAEEEDQVLELFDESLEAYKKALELNPENIKLQEMLELLDGPTADDEEDK
ncbi:hypothetical protein BC941DRAFT_513810 [Chlamydoabsidia padenii]|nr:hypothetical protein BC941DRAFT_513810 [Chlamydoabsidia padenii]